MRDLWPSDINSTSLIAPVAILKEQAALLGSKTSNVLEGEVKAIDREWWNDLTDFRYTLYLVAPTMNYRYRLLTIAHPIELYPVKLKTSQEIVVEEFSAEEPDAVIHVSSEDSLLSALRKIFAARKTRRVIAALLAQAGAATGTEPEIPF